MPPRRRAVLFATTRILALWVLSAGVARTSPATSTSVSASGPDQPLPLKSLSAVRRLSPTQAAEAKPVDLHGTITYVNPATGSLFIQDGAEGIYIYLSKSKASQPLQRGQLVTVRGITSEGSFAPTVTDAAIAVAGLGVLPPARRLQFDYLMAGREDSLLAEVSGIVRSGQITGNQLWLSIASNGGLFLARIKTFPPDWQAKLVDATVAVRGVIASVFNDRRQSIGMQMMVTDVRDIRVIEPPQPDVFRLPVSRTSVVGEFRPANLSGHETVTAQLDHRIHVQATVIGVEPGILYVADASGSLAVESRSAADLRPGDSIDIAGFPGAVDGRPGLQDAVWRIGGRPVLPRPRPIRGDGLPMNASFPTPTAALREGTRNDVVLIQTDVKLLHAQRSPLGQTLLVEAEGRQFLATLNLPPSGHFRQMEPGSRLRLTGVCLVICDQFRRAQAARILLRDQSDIVVVSRPPVPPAWYQQPAFVAVATLALAMLLILLRIAFRSWSAMHFQSRHDPLTGLANRRVFEHRLRSVVGHARRYRKCAAVLLLDLDHFKSVNDTLGHLAGDEFLREVSARLRRCVRKFDTLARLGGDEFAIIMPDLESRREAELVAARIVESVGQDCRIGAHNLRSAASVGISFFPDHAEDASGLSHAADLAMYECKQRGRGQYLVFEPGQGFFSHNDFLKIDPTVSTT